MKSYRCLIVHPILTFKKWNTLTKLLKQNGTYQLQQRYANALILILLILFVVLMTIAFAVDYTVETIREGLITP